VRLLKAKLLLAGAAPGMRVCSVQLIGAALCWTGKKPNCECGFSIRKANGGALSELTVVQWSATYSRVLPVG